MARKKKPEASAANAASPTMPASAPPAKKDETTLDRLHAEHERLREADKLPDAKATRALASSYIAAEKAKHEAEAQLNAANAKLTACATALIRAIGRGRVELPDGIVRIPTSKGDSVYLRPEGVGEVRKL